MGKSRFTKPEIRGLVCAVPRQTRTSEFFRDRFKADEIEKLTAMTGVRSRRVVDEKTCTSDLCAAAAETLLNKLAWDRESVDALVFVSQTPDYVLPATACVLQHRLKLSTDCSAFDINLGCSGYTYGLWMASSLIESGAARRVLLLVGDTTSHVVAPTDRSACFLFGDAGSATALEHSTSARPSFYVTGSDGAGAPHLIIPAGASRKPHSAETVVRKIAADGNERSEQDLYMSGSEVFNFTLAVVPKMARDLYAVAEREMNDTDAFIFHQANAFMLKHLQKKLKVDATKVPLSIDEFGNTSSASIPLTMASRLQATLREKDQRLALFGFGVGFSWCAALLQLPPLSCVEWIEYPA